MKIQINSGNERNYLLFLPMGIGLTALFLFLGIGAWVTDANWQTNETVPYFLFLAISIFFLVIGIISYLEYKKKKKDEAEIIQKK